MSESAKASICFCRSRLMKIHFSRMELEPTYEVAGKLCLRSSAAKRFVRDFLNITKMKRRVKNLKNEAHKNVHHYHPWPNPSRNAAYSSGLWALNILFNNPITFVVADFHNRRVRRNRVQAVCKQACTGPFEEKHSSLQCLHSTQLRAYAFRSNRRKQAQAFVS